MPPSGEDLLENYKEFRNQVYGSLYNLSRNYDIEELDEAVKTTRDLLSEEPSQSAGMLERYIKINLEHAQEYLDSQTDIKKLSRAIEDIDDDLESFPAYRGKNNRKRHEDSGTDRINL
jgi:hypothetical protein